VIATTGSIILSGGYQAPESSYKMSNNLRNAGHTIFKLSDKCCPHAQSRPTYYLPCFAQLNFKGQGHSRGDMTLTVSYEMYFVTAI